MEMKNIAFNEVRDLLLQGYKVKLPQWKGYWQMSEDNSTILAHLEDGEIEDANMLMAIFYDNWEVATPMNCPVLFQELEELLEDEEEEYPFEILDFSTLNLKLIGKEIMIIKIKRDNGEIEDLTFQDFVEEVGDEIEAHLLLKDHVFKNMPKHMQDEFRELNNAVENLIDCFGKGKKPDDKDILEIAKALIG